MVRPQTPFYTPHEPHPHAGEPANTEAADTPHADVDADNGSDPLSGTHPHVTMISLHHHPYQS